MKATETLNELIKLLLAERGESVPTLSEGEKERFLRALVNVRPPVPASEELLRLQDEYLQGLLSEKRITDIETLIPVRNGVYLWKGDITKLKCDGIVNAANSKLLGCFCPNHACIDNAIHTFAGMRLRSACAEIMQDRDDEPTGGAKITRAYNLPCKYVLHTVGPIVCGELTLQNEKDLESCYRSCLELADEKGLKSLAFCCISTGEFRFPNERAAEIAVKTVTEYKRAEKSDIKVVFNVFKEVDHDIYAKILATDK